MVNKTKTKQNRSLRQSYFCHDNSDPLQHHLSYAPSAFNQRPTMRCPPRSAQKARPWDPQESDVMRKRLCSLGERRAFRPIQAQPVCRHGSPSKAGTSLVPHDMQHRLCVRKSLGMDPIRPTKIANIYPQAGHLTCERLSLRLTCRG